MSSDLYIDSGDDWVRLGNMGHLSYFEYDVIAVLKVLAQTHPVVDACVVDALVPALELCRRWLIETIDDDDAEYHAVRYGYCLPTKEQIDVVDASQVTAFLRERTGRPWSFRVD